MMVSSSPLWGTCIGQWSGCTDRTVKYMANRPAKNISSLDSHTMVPTLTMFGRVSECTLLDSKLGAAAVEVTQALWPAHGVLPRPGWVVLPRFGAGPVRPVRSLDTIGGVNPVPEQVTVL